MFRKRFPKEERGRAGDTVQALGFLHIHPQSPLSASVCFKHRVPKFPLRSFLPLCKRLKPIALTILAPLSHDWFLLSLWSILPNGLAHLLWNEFSLNSFISPYITILFQWNRHRIKKWNADSKCVFDASLFALKEGSEQLLNIKRIFQMIAVKNGGHLEVPKLNKAIKQFLFTQIWKTNF